MISRFKPTYKYYTGVGSRTTPEDIMEEMTYLAVELAKLGFILRSGGADGADAAFKEGCDSVDGRKEIYVPWSGFNKIYSNNQNVFAFGSDKIAKSIAENLHPNWGGLTLGGQMLHTRNIPQVLGKDLETPSQFVICWTPGGKKKGGTATAISLAELYSIPVYNLFDKESCGGLWELLGQ